MFVLHIEHKFFRERILQIQLLIHNGSLINLQDSAWHVIRYEILGTRLNDVDEADCIGDFNLYGEDAVHGGIC